MEVEVIEKWDEDSRFPFEVAPVSPTSPLSEFQLPSCLVDDVKVGETYHWKISDVSSGYGSSGCYEALCPNDFPTPSKALSYGTTGRPRVAGTYPCTGYDRVAELMGCELDRVVGLLVQDGDLFDEPTVGKKPPVVIVRRFSLSTAFAEMCADPMRVFPEEAMMSDPAGDFWECADAWVVRVKKR